MEKLRELRQELVDSRSEGRFGNKNLRNSNEILDEMNVVLDEMENSLLEPDKELQEYKERTIGLYATDKNPETIFEEVFVHLIEEIGMDGEKTFAPMDYDYYKEFFNKGIKLLMWRIS
jgi:membrane peptidoglycan carboxypeptidase